MKKSFFFSFMVTLLMIFSGLNLKADVKFFARSYTAYTLPSILLEFGFQQPVEL